MTPAALYWEREVLDMSSGLDEDAGVFRWQLVLCLLAAWIIVFLCMCRGVKSSGKVVYFTAVFPYVVLIILCIRNALLEGSMDGILYYIRPDPTKLMDPSAWYAASVQIFYSLGIAFGGLSTMSSYNRFHNNCYRDALLVAVINCGTSVFAGFVIFSVIGHMAHVTGEDVSNVVDSGPGLAFVAYPEGIATMPAAPLWSILFFLMLITLGLDSQFTMLETVITALADEFELNKIHRHAKLVLTAALCLFMFLAGLPQCSRAGVYVMNLFDWYSAGYSLIMVAFFECVGIAWIYDFRRFRADIQMMLGSGAWINASFYYFWFPTWIVISPAMMLYIFVNMCVGYTPITYGAGVAYPAYADGIGFGMVLLAVICIPAVALIEYCKAHGFLKTMRKLVEPTASWGPALPQHRLLDDRYTQNLYGTQRVNSGVYDTVDINTRDRVDIEQWIQDTCTEKSKPEGRVKVNELAPDTDIEKANHDGIVNANEWIKGRGTERVNPDRSESIENDIIDENTQKADDNFGVHRRRSYSSPEKAKSSSVNPGYVDSECRL